jgi:FixJ family two-component response regulator
MTSQTCKPWVVILESDVPVCRSIVRLTWSYGLHCEAFTCAREFVAAIGSGRPSAPSCVVLDVDVPELNDPSVLESVKRISPHTPLILLGSGGEMRLREHPLAAGAGAFFEKPIDVDRFMATFLAMPYIAPVPSLLARLGSHATTSRWSCRSH